MSQLTAVALVLGLIGLTFALLALRRLRRRRLARGLSNGFFSICLCSVAALLLALSLNLHTYQRLTHEQEVAVLEFRQLGPQHYRVLLSAANAAPVGYDLYGDEWQLDARVLKWHGMATLLGLDSHYQLERLSGRYRALRDEKSRPRSVHALSEPQWLDLWALAEQHSKRLPWVDAYYGSAAYLPMREGARYQVNLTQTGLIARPLNSAGQQALEDWR